MARTKTQLDEAQALAVEKVRLAEIARRGADEAVRRDERAKMKERVAERMATITGERDRAVADAIESGVPRSHLEVNGVLGFAKGRVAGILASMEARGEVTLSPAAPGLTWLDNGDAHVSIPHFATTSQAEDYPTTLTGIVRQSDEVASGWAVVSDPTADASLLWEGHLAWELAQPDAKGHLGRLLTALASKHDDEEPEA